jgi:hypothetical protein
MAMFQPAVAAARMSRETATLGVPPRHTTLAGTRWAATAALGAILDMASAVIAGLALCTAACPPRSTTCR